MNKKISAINIIVMVVLVLCVAVAGTIAWLFSTASVENKLQFGQVQGEIVEDKWDDNQEVSLGATLAKNPAVKNQNATTPAYVRVKAVSSDSRLTVDCYNDVQTKLFTVGKALTNGTSVVGTKAADGGEWVYQDGYFYYNKVLAPLATTSTLFDQIQVTSEKNEELFTGDFADKNFPFDVYVMAELVQSTGIPSTGTTVVDRAVESFKEMMVNP